MTIMGILSVFCVLTIAGIANAFKDVKTKEETLATMVWIRGHTFIVCGCLCLMVAALFFYRQRSLLAWYYGQICLSEIHGSNGPVKQWLADADGWTTWRSYKAAFAALGAGFAELALGVLAVKYDWMSRTIIPLAIPVLIAIGYATTMWLILGIYEVEENPWRTFFSSLGINAND
jgi:hypothetical protein